MKPLLWRIAGCVLIAMPLAFIAWAAWDVIMFFGPTLVIFAGIVLGSAIAAFIAMQLFIVAGICFDKAKRPPR